LSRKKSEVSEKGEVLVSPPFGGAAEVERWIRSSKFWA
jgi:hypothetical protein